MAILRYPPDLTEDSRRLPYLKIQMVKYRERNFEYDGEGNITDISPNRELLNSVVLPLPENVSNTYNMNWEMANLQGVKFLEDIFSNNSIKDAIVSSGARDNLTAILFGQFSKIISQKTPNPKKQALFNGIDPRTFSFSFTFAPQSLREAEQLQKVIKELTVASLPSLETEEGEDDSSAAFFKFPAEFEITFGNVAGFPKLSSCVCTSIATNYSPTQIQLLESGHSVQTTLTLTFLETELLRKTKPGL